MSLQQRQIIHRANAKRDEKMLRTGRVIDPHRGNKALEMGDDGLPVGNVVLNLIMSWSTSDR
jgi:hypothetical protein